MQMHAASETRAYRAWIVASWPSASRMSDRLVSTRPRYVASGRTASFLIIAHAQYLASKSL